MSYQYDYRDRRAVKQDESGQGRIYFWDEVFGEVLWEFPLNLPGEQDLVRIFFNGNLIAENDTRPGGGLHFFYRDHLGTSKLTGDFFTDTAACDETYHPFGQLSSSLPSEGCNGHVRKFTGKERDLESGLDYFGARFYDSLTGRFLSPDPFRGSSDQLEPQTWNRYSYVTNSPLIFNDPDGLSKKKAIARLVGIVNPKVRKDFKNFLKRKRGKRADEIKNRKATLKEHERKNADLLQRGGRSIETERLRLELALRERIQEEGFQATIEDINKDLDKLFGAAVGVSISDVASLGDVVEEGLGGGILGAITGAVVDVFNPAGLIEDSAFVGALGDDVIEAQVDHLIDFLAFFERLSRETNTNGQQEEE